MSNENSEKAVLVTTEHRGVFFGYLDGEPSQAVTKLKNARNVLRWNGTKGFMGLAATGPTEQSRVGPRVPEQVLYKVTSVTTCTSEAVEKFEAQPWGR